MSMSYFGTLAAMARPTALVIGGTGPTGPFVVEGLHHRGFDVTILHGGQHEVEFSVPNVRHIHVDPHFAETLEAGIGGETYDLVVAQYGRLRIIADVFRGRTERLVAIGGATALFAGDEDERWGGTGRPALFPDSSEIFVRDPGEDDRYKLGLRMVQAMQGLLDNHAAGAYSATYIAYPVNYGARTPGPYDWATVRRLLDGRERIVIADGGIKLESRVYTENAAAAVLLAIDNPEIAAGKRYSVADRYAFTMRQRIEFIARHLGRDVELVDMPWDAAWPCHPLFRHRRDHLLCQSTLIREELGYEDEVEPDVAMARYVDWLVEHPPEPGGELERQVGDPFDYAAEDALIDRWNRARGDLGEIVSPLPRQGHQYRHPKKAGEAWSAGSPRP
jgi:nucleoside-diphosphate-sugar epimerase